MTIAYIIITVIVGLAALVGVGASFVMYKDAKSYSNKRNDIVAAQKVLKVSLLYLVFCWAWIALIPLTIAYLAIEMLRDKQEV